MMSVETIEVRGRITGMLKDDQNDRETLSFDDAAAYHMMMVMRCACEEEAEDLFEK